MGVMFERPLLPQEDNSMMQLLEGCIGKEVTINESTTGEVLEVLNGLVTIIDVPEKVSFHIRLSAVCIVEILR
jgi:hypothetical protein